jgi:tetratricopeptide (TPR) repeat protein
LKPTSLQLICGSAYQNTRNDLVDILQPDGTELVYLAVNPALSSSLWFVCLLKKFSSTCILGMKNSSPLHALNSQRRLKIVEAIFLMFVMFLFSHSFAQNSLEQLRTQVTNGYYASATKISGPLAIKENPDNPEAYFLFSQALYYAAETLEARVQLDKALTLLSNEPPAEYVHLNGLITASEGNLPQAVTLLETAFLRSQDYSVAMDWGDTAWQAGDFDTALGAFQAATTTERGKTELWPYLNQGRILQQAKNDPDGAMTAYQTVLDIFDANYPGGTPAPPSVVEANFRLGEVYESLGDKATAKSYYDAALYLDRNYTPAKNALDRLVRNP